MLQPALPVFYAADVHAVVGLPSADELGSLRLAFEVPIGPRHLQRRIHGLGARVAEKHVVEVRWRHGLNAVRELERQRMAELKSGSVIQRRELLADGGRYFPPVVAEAAAPHPGKTVEYSAPVRSEVMAAVAADNHARFIFKVAVAGVRHPIGFQIVAR